MPRALSNSCLEQRRLNLKITQKSRIPVYNTISSLYTTWYAVSHDAQKDEKMVYQGKLYDELHYRAYTTKNMNINDSTCNVEKR